MTDAQILRVTHSRVRVYDDEGERIEMIADIIAANECDDELCDGLLRLRIGESMTVGGGAAPLVTIERVA